MKRSDATLTAESQVWKQEQNLAGEIPVRSSWFGQTQGFSLQGGQEPGVARLDVKGMVESQEQQGQKNFIAEESEQAGTKNGEIGKDFVNSIMRSCSNHWWQASTLG